MIYVDKLRGIFAEKGVSQVKVARMLGIAPKTFYEKMKNGVFNSNEIQTMIDELDIKEPEKIFFTKR